MNWHIWKPKSLYWDKLELLQYLIMIKMHLNGAFSEWICSDALNNPSSGDFVQTTAHNALFKWNFVGTLSLGICEHMARP